MKVLLSSHGAGPYGAERMLLALGRGLVSRGHRVVLDFPHAGPAVDSARSIRGAEVRVDARRRLPRRPLEAVGYFATASATIAALQRVVREVEPDVIWANSLFNAWAVVASYRVGIPVVWHLHERNLPGVLGHFVSVLITALCTEAVAVSDYVAGSYRGFPGVRPRLRTLHNPLLGAPATHPLRHSSPFTVGFVGQLEPRKRAVDLARGIALLNGVHAVFVGDGKARRQLEDTIRRYGIGDRAAMLGYRHEVHARLGDFHCLAIPSLREPFGLVALEGMAAGVPIVAARSGALPEVLGDAALFHEAADPADLARQIERLRASPELREELRRLGLRRIQHFDHSRWLDAVEDVLGAVAHPQERS